MPYLLGGIAGLLSLLYLILFIPKLMGDTGEAGALGDLLNALLLWCGGWASYMIPALLCIVAWRWRGLTREGKTHGILWLEAGLVFVLTASIFELLGNYAPNADFSDYLDAISTFGGNQITLKGGAIGGLVVFAMRWALRTIISSVLLISADILCIIVLFGFSPEQVVSAVKKYIDRRRDEREAALAEYDDEENEIEREIRKQEKENAARLKEEEYRRKRLEAEALKEERRLKRQKKGDIAGEQEAEKPALEAEPTAQEPQEDTPAVEEVTAAPPAEEAASESTPTTEASASETADMTTANENAQEQEEEPVTASTTEVIGESNEDVSTESTEEESFYEEDVALNVTDLDFDLKDPERRTVLPKSRLPGDDALFGSMGVSSTSAAPAEVKPVDTVTVPVEVKPVDTATAPAAVSEPAVLATPAEEERAGVVDDVDDGVDFVAPPTEEEQKEPEYVFPSFELLAEDTANTDISQFMDEIEEKQTELGQALTSFGVRYRKIEFSRGPTITRYEIQPEPGQRVKTIQNLMDDIALSMAVSGVRFEPSIPGKSAVGIEVPNTTRETVFLRGLVESEAFQSEKSRLTSCLGADITGRPVVFDISKMPHLLVAGATGMGKSVCINSIILSLLYKAKPDEVKMILIDPKKVEFAIYRDMPHLQIPVISDPQKAAGALCSAVSEMEKRFELIERVGARDIGGYKKVTAGDPDMPKMWHMVIIIDELADLMMTASDDVEKAICRLAQKARAAGIHLIIGTQRPSVDVITGTIKANIPSRIAFTVASQTDSRTILDSQGAEKLVGKGDMLFAPVGASKPRRVQGSFVSEDEVIRVVNFLIRHNGTAKYDSQFMENIDIEAERCANSKKASESAAMLDDGDEDPKMNEAVKLAIESGKISTSLMQRRLEIGYGRAAKIIDRMEQLGYVSAADGNKPRKILITMDEYLARMDSDTEE